MDNLKEFQMKLRDDGIFQQILEQAKTKRPDVPSYNCKDDNTEEWKARSYMQQGFDLCYLAITGKKLET